MCPNSGMATMEGHIAHIRIIGNILLHVTPVIYNAVLFYWYFSDLSKGHTHY